MQNNSSSVTISYIIVRYKVEKELFLLLDSIFSQKVHAKTEVIVVDNNTKERIEKKLLKKYSKVIYVKNSVNNGLGAAVNLGVERAHGEFLFVLNPDTVLQKQTTNILLSFMKNNKSVGLVSPSYILESGEQPILQVGTRKLTPIRGIFSLSFLSKIFKNNKIYNDFYITKRDRSKNLEVDAVPGGAFVVKKEIFIRSGKFDPNFFLYFEEHDLSNRVKKLGYRNWILADAKIFHIGGIDSENLKGTRVFKKSRLYYFQKHYGFFTAYFVDVICSISKKDVILAAAILLAFLGGIYALFK